jgi:type VI secretion system protein ImpI
MILVVKIHAPKGGTNQTLRFAKSPIRIGRNQLNDISLDDPFVSEWHGTLRFDQQSVAYFDLGSTNGTLLDGKRLPKNVATPLSETSVLKLGLLQVQVEREAEAEQVTPPPAAWGGGDMQHTLPWGRVNRADFAPGGPGFAMVGPGATGAVRAPPVAGSASTSLRGARQPASAEPAPPASAADAADPAMASHREKLLEAFIEAFVGLRKGYEQFGAEVGVRTINGATPLHRARSQRELLDYMLQPNLDAEAIAKDIIAIFADFGIHHLAMMQGVTEGVRTLLQSLSPQANAIDAGGRLFTGGKAKTQWKAYLERFDQMINDDNELHTAVFGNEFARAYASVTLGDGGKASSSNSPEEDES